MFQKYVDKYAFLNNLVFVDWQSLQRNWRDENLLGWDHYMLPRFMVWTIHSTTDKYQLVVQFWVPSSLFHRNMTSLSSLLADPSKGRHDFGAHLLSHLPHVITNASDSHIRRGIVIVWESNRKWLWEVSV